MKSVKITLSMIAFLLFAGLSDIYGQWGTSGTNIYNTNTGNVGIGNNAPTYLMHVGKNMTEPTITIQNFGGFGGATYAMIDNASGANWKFKATTIGGFKIRDHANSLDVITIEPNSIANAIYIDADGNVAMSQNVTNGHGLNVQNYTMGKAAVNGTNQAGPSIYSSGMLGLLAASTLGVPVDVYNVGVFGMKPNVGANGAGVYGWNLDAGNSANYGGIFVAEGSATISGNTNYGVYGYARHANQNIAGKFVGRVMVDGHANAEEAPDYISTVLVSRVNHTVNDDTRAIYGISQPAEGYGIAVDGMGNYIGVRGQATSATYEYSTYGVFGTNSGSVGTRYGVYGTASGTGTGARIGVYGFASGGDIAWAGYFSGDAYISSDLRIATQTQATGYALSVNGKIACEEVLVEDMVNWPDYVFADDYNLMSLDELEQSIESNNHLPGLPSAAEIEENGLTLGDMQKRMIEKIEELTLYTIQQNKMIQELQEKMENLEKENKNLREKIK